MERGHCSNPTKVRNVENFGGAVALIADYKEEDVDALVMSDFQGSGQSLTIPGFMIEYNSAQKIKNVLSEGKEVTLKA